MADDSDRSGRSRGLVDNGLGDVTQLAVAVLRHFTPSALLLAADPDGNVYVGQTLHPNSGDVMP